MTYTFTWTGVAAGTDSFEVGDDVTCSLVFDGTNEDAVFDIVAGSVALPPAADTGQTLIWVTTLTGGAAGPASSSGATLNLSTVNVPAGDKATFDITIRCGDTSEAPYGGLITPVATWTTAAETAAYGYLGRTYRSPGSIRFGAPTVEVGTGDEVDGVQLLEQFFAPAPHSKRTVKPGGEQDLRAQYGRLKDLVAMGVTYLDVVDGLP